MACALAWGIGTAASVSTGVAAQVVGRPSLVVQGFESGTVSAQVQDRRGFAAIVAAMHGGHNETYDPSQLGTGIADMLVEKLLDAGQFRLLERKPVDTPTNAQYIVAGSVTKFVSRKQCWRSSGNGCHDGTHLVQTAKNK
jgi:curli biogenesis system outer membrane secretion channel CsgG